MESMTASQMVDDITHCAAIASSALTLAHDRSMDINVPPIITLTLLKKLCEVNIAQEFTDSVHDEVVEAFSKKGLDFHKMRERALRELNEMVDEYFEVAKKKVVTR